MIDEEEGCTLFTWSTIAIIVLAIIYFGPQILIHFFS